MRITLFGGEVKAISNTWNVRIYPYIVNFGKNVMLYVKDGARHPLASNRSIFLNLVKEQVDVEGAYRNIVIYLDLDKNEVSYFGEPITRIGDTIKETYVDLSRYHEFVGRNVLILADVRIHYGMENIDEAIVNYDRRAGVLFSADGIMAYKDVFSEVSDTYATVTSVGQLLREYNTGEISVILKDGEWPVYIHRNNANSLPLKPRHHGDNFVHRYYGVTEAGGLFVYSINDSDNTATGPYLDIGEGNTTDWKMLMMSDGCALLCEFSCQSSAQLCCQICSDSAWANAHDDSPSDPCYQDCGETCSTEAPCGNCEYASQVGRGCRQVDKPLRLQKCELTSGGEYKANNAYETKDFAWDDIFTRDKDGKWKATGCPSGWDVHAGPTNGFNVSYLLWSFHDPCKKKWVGWELEDRATTNSLSWKSCNDFKATPNEDVTKLNIAMIGQKRNDTGKQWLEYEFKITKSDGSVFNVSDKISLSISGNAKMIYYEGANAAMGYQYVKADIYVYIS